MHLHVFVSNLLQVRGGITSKHLFGMEDLFYKYGKYKISVWCNASWSCLQLQLLFSFHNQMGISAPVNAWPV